MCLLPGCGACVTVKRKVELVPHKLELLRQLRCYLNCVLFGHSRRETCFLRDRGKVNRGTGTRLRSARFREKNDLPDMGVAARGQAQRGYSHRGRQSKRRPRLEVEGDCELMMKDVLGCDIKRT